MCVSVQDAVALVAQFKTRFSQLTSYLKSVVTRARKSAYIQTLAGRIRKLPHIRSSNNMARLHAERQAINSTIQGSAADIVKAAMLKADADITNRELDAHLIAQVHDELVYEVRSTQLAEAVRVIADAMCSAWQLTVPLKVTAHAGASWGAIEPIDSW